jgi:hypothetical protein
MLLPPRKLGKFQANEMFALLWASFHSFSAPFDGSVLLQQYMFYHSSLSVRLRPYHIWPMLLKTEGTYYGLIYVTYIYGWGCLVTTHHRHCLRYCRGL